MPEDAHAPLRGAALDFEHLCQLESLQPRMSKIERDGDARHAVGREPFVRNPEMWTKAEVLGLKFLFELTNMARQKGTLDCDVETAHRKLEQLFIGPRHPRRLALTQIRGRSVLRMRSRHTFPQSIIHLLKYSRSSIDEDLVA